MGRSRGLACGVAALLALVALGLWAPGTSAAPAPPLPPASASADEVAQGASLFTTGCSSCHGLDAKGSAVAPSLVDVGAAAVDFQLSTGRMPLPSPDAPSKRKPPAYDADQIAALAAFVASLGSGPAIPTVDTGAADVVLGGERYRANCAACHNAAGSGGALSYGRNAPSLLSATPVQVAEALRTGPGQMPVFGPSALDDAEVADIAAYVTGVLQEPDNRGGLPLGATGPVPEGFVAWVVGLIVVGGALRWIVGRHA